MSQSHNNLFDSRSEARSYAQTEGGKVKDRGSHLKESRWQVVAANVAPQVVTELSVAVHDMGETFEGTGETSAFFASRIEARNFSKRVNGKLVDNALLKYGTKNDLGKQGRRWEVVYTSTDDLWDDRVLGAEEKYVDTSDQPITQEPIVLMTLKNLQVTLPNGKNFVISRSHEDFNKCAQLFVEGKIEDLIQAINVENKPKEWSFGEDLKVIGGTLYHHGMAVDSTIAKRIVDDCNAGITTEKYVEFFRKLIKNTSYKAVKMVYDFIQHNDLVITDSGDIKAWKMIRETGYDCATNKVPNFKGVTVSMPRNLVEDNPEVTCSYGLHVAAKEYFNHHFHNEFLVEVLVSPQDIVSVPVDYNNSKCRSCRYTVLTGLDKPENIPYHVWIDENGGAITGAALAALQ